MQPEDNFWFCHGSGHAALTDVINADYNVILGYLAITHQLQTLI
jgi:hypothetical protein